MRKLTKTVVFGAMLVATAAAAPSLYAQNVPTPSQSQSDATNNHGMMGGDRGQQQMMGGGMMGDNGSHQGMMGGNNNNQGMSGGNSDRQRMMRGNSGQQGMTGGGMNGMMGMMNMMMQMSQMMQTCNNMMQSHVEQHGAHQPNGQHQAPPTPKKT